VRHVTTLESAGIGVNRSPDDPNSAVLRTPRNPVQLAMGLGTKNRQKQTAETCKRHLREKYRDLGELVEDKEMLERLDAHFQEWLNP
jgi:hypothetical protein